MPEGHSGSRIGVALCVAALGLGALVGGASGAGASARTARAGPGMAQLAGPDACYAQREEGSEASALCRVGKGLIDAAAPLVSPDGKSVYVAAWGSSAVGVFARGASGRLREFACVSNNGTTGIDGTERQCADGDAMWGATALASSPDGKNVYVASYMSGGVAELTRDPGSGRLKQTGCVRPVPTCTGARGLSGATSIAVSPDGANVYVAAAAADAVTSLARDPATGALKGIGCVSDDGTDRMCGKGNALRGADAVVVSPDGRFVYAAAGDSDSVLTFARDPATGLLTQRGCALLDAPKPGSCTRANGIGGPVALALAPDGRTLFVAAYSSHAVAVFARNAATGALTQRGCVSDPYEDEDEPVKDGCVHLGPLQDPTAIAVSPDGFRLYVTGDSGLTVLDRDRTTGGLRLAGCVSYKDYWDDEVTRACQLGRGVAGASGVAVSPDGRNVYVTASESDAVAAFAPAVSMSLEANVRTRRLTVRLTCPSSREAPCAGRVALDRRLVQPRPYRLAAGESRRVVVALPRGIVRAVARRPLPLLVSASDRDRAPVLRRITLGARPAHRLRVHGTVRTDTAGAIWRGLHSGFCAPRASAGWCRYVERVAIDRTTLVGVTTLASARQARGAAAHICSALSTFAFAAHSGRRLDAVRVTGRHGRTLAWRPNLAARCSP